MCQLENDTYHEPFSVAVVTDDHIVGNIPKRISTVCSLFLCRGGGVICITLLKCLFNIKHSLLLDLTGESLMVEPPMKVTVRIRNFFNGLK